MENNQNHDHKFVLGAVLLALVVIVGGVVVLDRFNINPLRSHANFTCQRRVSSFQILSPNRGEILEAGTQSQIQWYQNCGGREQIEIALKKGPVSETTYYNIANNARTVPGENNFYWTIPEGFDGSDFNIRIGYKLSSIQYDLTDQPFTIRANNTTINPPNITVVSPNGGEVLRNGETASIKWNQSAPSADPVYVRIQLYYFYPTGGSSASTIITESTPSYEGENQYLWTIPSTINASSIYKVVVTLDRHWPPPHIFSDFSDQIFTISRP